MELDKISQVKKVVSDNAANRLLEKDWVLLDAKVVQWTKAEGTQEAGTIYVLGKPRESEVKEWLKKHQEKG